jgi:hypothetical protein
MSMSRLPVCTLFGVTLILAASVALGLSRSAGAAPDEHVPPVADSKPADPVPAPASPTAPTPAAEAPAPAASAEEPATSGNERTERKEPESKFAEPAAEVLEQWKKQVAGWKEVEPREAADNSFCYVCHLNYENDKEKLVAIHEPEGVGCETCHGMSAQHSQDEDSLVPPDVIFASNKVASFCVQCHEKRDLLEGDESHEKFFAGETEPDKTCTSCHDMKHSLKVRTRRWDKDSRKIEWYDGVRMMQEPDKPSTPESTSPK